MNDEVKKLEQEANDARARLKSDLLVLSSSHTYEAFKEDLRTEANDTLSKLIDAAKARVAANPAAALAIGAGIAWRIIESCRCCLRHAANSRGCLRNKFFSIIHNIGDSLTEVRCTFSGFRCCCRSNVAYFFRSSAGDLTCPIRRKIGHVNYFISNLCNEVTDLLF